MEFAQPNFINGFARNASESLYPQLWNSLIFCMSPSVGKTGEYIIDWSGNFKKAPFPTQDSLATWVNDGKYFAPCIEFAAYAGGYSVNNKGIFFNQFDNDTSYPKNFIGNGTYQKGYTFSFWVKGTAANLQPFLHAQLNNYQDSANYLYFFFNSSTTTNIGGSNLNTAAIPVLDGKWHHIVFVVAETTTYLYIDDRLAGTKVTTNYSLTVPGGMSIGAPGNVGAGAAWRMGDFFIWNRPITPSEITALYGGATPLALAPLPTVTASPNVTIEPTILTLASSIESPTIIIDSTFDATPLDLASSIESPQTVGEAQIVSVTELDIASSIESPSLEIDASFDATPLDIASEIVSPTVPQDMTITPTPLDIASSIQDPTISEIFTTAHFGTKIISINPLIFVSDTSPIRITKVDTSVPTSLTWIVEPVTGVNNALDASVQTFFNADTATSNTNPGTAANDTGIGSIAWTNTGNILTSNDSRASLTLSGLTVTNYLKATNFGFAIPTDATILGFTVRIERRRSGGTTGEARDSVVRLIRNNVVSGTNKAVATNYPTTEAVATYGSTTDLWGNFWTPSHINASTFGVVLACVGSTGATNRVAEVDNITIAVAYKTVASRYIYIASADGKLVKAEFDDITNHTVLDASDSDELTAVSSVDESTFVYAATDSSVGELYSFQDIEATFIDTEFTVLREIGVKLDSDFACTEAKYIDGDFHVLGIKTGTLDCDFKCLTNVLDNITPIKRTEFVVFVDNVQLDDTDVNLSTITITHTVDQKSSAVFTLTRRHDNINQDLQGNTRTITANNVVRIEIQGNIEFEGKVANISCQYGTTDQVVVTAYQQEPEYDYSTVNLSLPSLDKRLGLYDVLVQNPQINNEYIDPNESRPRKYKGIRVPYGFKTTQSVLRFHQVDGLSTYAEAIANNTFVPKQNWTYFWSPTVYKPKFFAQIVGGNTLGDSIPAKPDDTPFHALTLPVFTIPEFQFPGTQATGQTTLIHFDYIGTSLSPVSSDVWVLKHAEHRYQKILDDIVERIGSGIITQGEVEELNTGIDTATLWSALIGAGYIDGSGNVQETFGRYIFKAEDLNINYSTNVKNRVYDLLTNSYGFYLGTAPYRTINTRNGVFVPKFRWVDFDNGLYSVLDEGYNYIAYAQKVAELEYKKLQNINGQIQPDTSCSLEMALDAYYYFNLKLLKRVNIDNTTSAGIFKNNNGFPVSIKTITISSASMRISIAADNSKSNTELAAIDGQYPNEDDSQYNSKAQKLLISLKSDMATRLKVE